GPHGQRSEFERQQRVAFECGPHDAVLMSSRALIGLRFVAALKPVADALAGSRRHRSAAGGRFNSITIGFSSRIRKKSTHWSRYWVISHAARRDAGDVRCAVGIPG